MVVKQTFGSGRSGRKHKAWGASPRNETPKTRVGARVAGGSAVARCAGWNVLCIAYLGLAPQALCFHPLRGLKKFEADRGGNLFVITSWRQAAGVLVDFEGDDVITPLIRHEQKSPRGIDREIARPVARG